MGFSTERKDNWWWLMVSGDVNANRLLLAVMDNPAWKDDIGRLVRGSMGRQKKGRWDTTVANAWGPGHRQILGQVRIHPVTGASAVSWAMTPRRSCGMARRKSVPCCRRGRRHGYPGPGAQRHGQAVGHRAKPGGHPLKAPVSSGYTIRKTITPVEQKTAGAWSRGDVYRVRLDLSAQADA
jgi:hypothetical protein